MTTRRWLLVVVSFAAAIGVSLYLVLTSWPADGTPVVLPLAAHGLALVAVLAEIATRALKIQFSARAIRVPLRFRTAVRVCLGGDFGAAITPARSGAEPARFFVLSQAGVAPVSTLLILFAELFLEMLSLAAIAIVLAILFSGEGAVIGGLVGLVGGYAGFVIGAAVFGMVLARRNANGPPPRVIRAIGLNAGHWRTVQRALRQLRTGVTGLRDASLPLMTGALAFSIMHVLLRLTILPVIVFWLVPGTMTASDLSQLVLWPLALLYGAAVAPAPGGGGLIEVAFKAALGGAIPAAAFATALVWWRFYTFYLYIIFGALAAGGTVLRALRADAEPDAAAGVEGRIPIARRARAGRRR